MSKPGVVNIRGREYQTVALRVSTFREKHPAWSMETEIIQRDAEVVVMKATIKDEAGRVMSTGHAEEYRNSSQINETSATENCETSAIGRALAALGLGGQEFASADELANALRQQGGTKGPIPANHGAMDNIPKERHSYINDQAGSIIDCFNAGQAETGWKVWLEVKDNEERLAVWSYLDSKMRRELKRRDAEAAEAAKVKAA